MKVDRKWVERNLGFDPISQRPPDGTFAVKRAASKEATSEDLQREIIDFDSESPAGLQFLSFTTATGLSRYVDVPWPKGLAPITGPKPKRSPNAPLPHADVLVVTWTVDEGHALSRVLTPGKDSRDDYLPYTQLCNHFQKNAQRLSGASGKAPRRVLDDEDRKKVGRGLQIGLAFVARRTATAKY